MSKPAPWRNLKRLEPPLGSQQRVAGEIERVLDQRSVRRPAGRRALPAAAVIGGLVIAGLWVLGGEPDREPRAAASASASANARQEMEVRDAAAPDEPSAVAHRASPDASPAAAPDIRLDEGEKVSLELPAADVEIAGPSRMRVERDVLFVEQGRLSVAGYAAVRTPTCSAKVVGRADVRVTSTEARFAVASGRVHSASESCIIELDTAASAEPAAEKRLEVAGGSGEPSRSGKPSRSSALRHQVNAFRQARALAGAPGMEKLRAFIARWPDSPLRPEAEAALVDRLLEAGQSDRAQRAMRRFVERYPDHFRARQFRRSSEARE